MLQEQLLNSVIFISLDRNKALAALRAAGKKIHAEHPEVKDLRLFGSLARGDQSGVSDADVLIVLRGGGQLDVLQQTKMFYPYFDLPIAVDVLVCTEEQIAKRLADGEPFMRRLWRESAPL